MRVDKLIAQYFDSERSVGKANHFKNTLANILRFCDDAQIDLATLTERLYEKCYGTTFLDYLIQCYRQYPENANGKDENYMLRTRFANFKMAFINRFELKEILAPYVSSLEKAAEQAKKECEEARNKIKEEFQRYVAGNFKDNEFATYLLESGPVLSALFGFLLQDEE